jgi:hypothetical protein
MKTLALLVSVLVFTACQSCRTPGDQPASPVVTTAVTCGAPAAAELISDATAALASLDTEWRTHLTAAATKYGAQALNCALQQMLSGWQSARAVSADERRSVDRAAAWLWPATGAASPAATPQQVPRNECCSQCVKHSSGQTCVLFLHCNISC